MKPETTAFVFPGQGSQTVNMGHELAAAYPAAQAVFEESDQILGFPLSQLAWEGPVEELNDTVNTQPALLTHSAAVLKVFQQVYPNFKPAYAAGHSMGELSALLAAQSLDFQAALILARRRGELMKEAGEINPGGMAAILGIDITTMEAICAEASSSRRCGSSPALSAELNRSTSPAYCLSQSTTASRFVNKMSSIISTSLAASRDVSRNPEEASDHAIGSSAAATQLTSAAAAA